MINAGIYVLEPSFLEWCLAEGVFQSSARVSRVLLRLARSHALGSHALWTDMGTRRSTSRPT